MLSSVHLVSFPPLPTRFPLPLPFHDFLSLSVPSSWPWGLSGLLSAEFSFFSSPLTEERSPSFFLTRCFPSSLFVRFNFPFHVTLSFDARAKRHPSTRSFFMCYLASFFWETPPLLSKFLLFFLTRHRFPGVMTKVCSGARVGVEHFRRGPSLRPTLYFPPPSGRLFWKRFASVVINLHFSPFSRTQSASGCCFSFSPLRCLSKTFCFKVFPPRSPFFGLIQRVKNHSLLRLPPFSLIPKTCFSMTVLKSGTMKVDRVCWTFLLTFLTPTFLLFFFDRFRPSFAYLHRSVPAPWSERWIATIKGLLLTYATLCLSFVRILF